MKQKTPDMKINKRRRGFSLTELAIVLGIVAGMLGGVWWFVKLSREYSRRELAGEEITMVVNSVRATMASTVSMPALGTQVLVGQFAARGAIPSYMIRNPAGGCLNVFNGNAFCADNPWGQISNGGVDNNGTFHICDWTLGGGQTACNAGAGAGTTQFFAIEETGLDIGTCVALTARISSASGPSGLVEVYINQVSVVLAAGGTLPVSDAATNANCVRVAPNTNTVAFIYRVHAPMN